MLLTLKNPIVKLMLLCSIFLSSNSLVAQDAYDFYYEAVDYYFEDDYNSVFRTLNPLLNHFDANKAGYTQSEDGIIIVFKVYNLMIQSYYETGNDGRAEILVNNLIEYFRGLYSPTEVISILEGMEI